MRFTEPVYLLLLIPTVAWLLWVARSIRGTQTLRRNVTLVLRVLVLISLIFALAGLQTVRTNKGVTTLFVLDRSASMGSEAAKQAEMYIGKSLEALSSDDKAGLIVFGKEPVIDTAAGSLRNLGKIYAAPDVASTDIAAALRLATASFPEGTAKRVVLLSDGNETVGDANQAALVAATDGVQIDAVKPPETNGKRAEVIVGDVTTPSQVTKGEPFELRTQIQSTGAAIGTLRIDRDGIPVARVPVKLNEGNNSIVVSQAAPEPGFYRYRAVVESPNDTDPRNNAGIGYVAVRGKPKVLLIDGKRGAGDALKRALAVYDIEVKQGGAEVLPTRIEDLQEYDAVLFNDLSADLLTVPQMRLFAAATRESGVGFGMIGGENSFLSGGYYETPIADILPVDLNVRQRKTFPSTTILIVMDASGSMGMIEDGVQKLKIAASAAAASVRMMNNRDFVGVAGSSDGIEFVVPIQLATDKERLAAAAGTVSVNGGGIYIRPSLDFAYKALQKQNTRVRHLILMADGDDSEDQAGSFEIARQMVAEKMTLSVVAIGNGKDVEFLKQLAREGHGNYFIALKANQLQRLFTRDTAMMSRSAIEEGAFIPKVDAGDPILQGLGLNGIPPLFAYDLTSDRPLSRIVMRTNKDDPLLAVWQYGLGTSLAFTSDAQSRWARQWIGWRDFNAFWAQSVRAILRQASNNRLNVTTRRDGGKAVVTVEAFDSAGQPLNNLNAQANALSPDGAAQPVGLRQVGPGRYEGTFDTPETGGYVLSVAETASGAGGQPRITRAGYALAYPPEYQAIRANTSLLEQIAAATGGKILQNPVEAFRRPEKPGKAIRDLYPELLTIAALLFLLDIAFRRLALPINAIAASVTQSFARLVGGTKRPVAANAPQAQTVARLQQATKRTVRETTVNDTNNPPNQPNDTDSSPRMEAPRPVAPSKPETPSGGTSAAERLLDLKRKGK